VKYLNVSLIGLALLALAVLLMEEETVLAKGKTSDRLGASTPWRVICLKRGISKKRKCKIVQKVLVKKTKKLLVAAAINRAGPKNEKTVMLLQLPTGLYLPAGVAVQIDKNKAHPIVVQTCDVRGCFTGLSLSDTMIANMKKGNSMTIAFKNLKKQTIAVGLSLSGFTAAFKRI